MIEEDTDPIEQQGPVGVGDPDLEIRNDPALEILTLPAAQQRSPDSLPDFEDHEYQAPDALGDPANGVPAEEEEILASPTTPEAQIEQIEADNALAEQLQAGQAEEQMLADNALARQLQAPHSITVPRVRPENGQIPESTITPGARGSRDILLPDPNDPAAHIQQLPENNRRNRRTNSQRRSSSPSTKLGHSQQLTTPTSATIGSSVQLPALLEQPSARNEPFQDERKHKESPT